MFNFNQVVVRFDVRMKLYLFVLLPYRLLLLITNLMSSRDRVIILEEPELHIHPAAQRALQAVIDAATEQNQLMYVTH